MAQLSVLIADDNEPMRVMLASVLQRHFALHKPVANGRELLQSVLAAEPDVAVVDVWMPGLSGIDALRALRRLGRTTPFVMVSADASIAADCLEAGAAAFVSKLEVERDLVPAVLAAYDKRILYGEAMGALGSWAPLPRRGH